MQTRIGTLNFVDGVPTAETTQKVYDNLDFLRGVEVFLNFIPAASIESMRRGMIEAGATRSNQAVIFDNLMDSNPLFLTGNTDTVYCLFMLDLETDGPTVVEVPAGSGPGTVNDAFFRFVVDMGGPGPDKGQGGKYLIVPAGYKGALPESGYFIAHSPSHVNWLILRGFLIDGKPDTSSRTFRNGVMTCGALWNRCGPSPANPTRQRQPDVPATGLRLPGGADTHRDAAIGDDRQLGSP